MFIVNKKYRISSIGSVINAIPAFSICTRLFLSNVIVIFSRNGGRGIANNRAYEGSNRGMVTD